MPDGCALARNNSDVEGGIRLRRDTGASLGKHQAEKATEVPVKICCRVLDGIRRVR